MKIIKENNQYSLLWKYSIQNNKKTTNDRDYYFYNVVFPAELADYFNQPSSLWMYENIGRTFICKDEPPYSKSRELKLFSKGNPQRAKDITLSKKFFTELEGHVQGKVLYILHVDEHDPLTNERGLLEVKLLIEQE